MSQALDCTIEGLTAAAIQSAREVGELECELAKSIATIDELDRAAAASTARSAELSREVEEQPSKPFAHLKNTGGKGLGFARMAGIELEARPSVCTTYPMMDS
jgi:hypothetical protein